MTDRSLPGFKEAEDRVKINHFTRQGYDITGLVHIGANDGYEIEYYLNMGIERIIAFEPLDSARKIMFQKYRGDTRVWIWDSALGNLTGEMNLNVTPGDGKGSSFLPQKAVATTGTQITQMCRWADLAIRKSDYNCCVIDVQGMELDVLRGMDEFITEFDFLSVECSKIAIYKGEATVWEVVTYLSNQGFVCQTFPFPDHDDVMFVNSRVLHSPEPPKPIPDGSKLNIGSGQRPFSREHGWINVDCVSKPGQVPDLLLDVGTEPLPYPENSMDLVVLHQVYEHFGCGEGHALIRESQRVLKPDGSLIVTVPDLRALAKRWLEGDLEDFLYMVNLYGAYQGEPGDRHKWGYDTWSLMSDLDRASHWTHVKLFNWRFISGADIARDWWILGVECVK